MVEAAERLLLRLRSSEQIGVIWDPWVPEVYIVLSILRLPEILATSKGILN